jgi:thiol-disulfide isomerase/thioredoxin
MDKIQEIDELSKKGRVVTMVGASWCGPCKLKKPTFLVIKEKHTNIHMEFIDVDDHPEFKDEHSIQKLPTFLVFEDSKEIKRMEGAKQTMAELEEFILS